MARMRKSVNHQLMHKLNRSLVLSSLRKSPSQTRAELAEYTGLTRSTVSKLVDELIDNHLVHEVGYSPSRGGRPGTQLELNPRGGCAIAVKIGKASIDCILTNFVGDLLWQERSVQQSCEVQPTLQRAEALIQRAIDYNDGRLKLLGIGVGVSGIVGQDGTVQQSVHLGWQNIAFRTQWQEKYGIPVSVDNEVNLAALGESYYGSALNDMHFMYIEVGYGVGAGIVIDGKLFRGINGYAGELGFMMMDCDEIVPWESRVNIPALVKQVQHGLQQGEASTLKHGQLNFQTITEALEKGDTLVASTLVHVSRRIAVGLASMVNTLDIPLIILGGELGKRFEPYLDVIQEEIHRHIVRVNRTGLELRVSTLQPDACLMGAIAQVLDEILQEPSWQANK